MSFFNQKEEVLDIKLTQFGKNCLARGVFKPVFYRFFDDDILYNLEKGGRTEHQNDTEKRILEETPRLKTQHLSCGVEEQYFKDDQEIIDRKKARFERLEKNVKLEIQEKILKYSLGEQEVTEQDNPRFSLRSFGAEFTNSGSVDTLHADGIVKKIPQLNLEPTFKILREEIETGTQNVRITDEDHYDLTAEKVLFDNGIQFSLEKQKIIIDIQELSTFYGSENFEIEIFEIQENENTTNLNKISSLESLRERFVIKTDEDVELKDKKTMKQTNFRREEEY
tara:strand:- start:694 stop:1536 length:843 start_codon:yes stop_codon:yes gene_type:complete